MNDVQEKPWTMMGSTTLFGQVGAILCWYWNGTRGGPEADWAYIKRGIDLLPDLLQGRTQHFTRFDWWIFNGPLTTYPEKTPNLEELHTISSAGAAGDLPLKPTTAFIDSFYDEDVMGNVNLPACEAD